MAIEEAKCGTMEVPECLKVVTIVPCGFLLSSSSRSPHKTDSLLSFRPTLSKTLSRATYHVLLYLHGKPIIRCYGARLKGILETLALIPEYLSIMCISSLTVDPVAVDSDASRDQYRLSDCRRCMKPSRKTLDQPQTAQSIDGVDHQVQPATHRHVSQI